MSNSKNVKTVLAIEIIPSNGGSKGYSILIDENKKMIVSKNSLAFENGEFKLGEIKERNSIDLSSEEFDLIKKISHEINDKKNINSELKKHIVMDTWIISFRTTEHKTSMSWHDLINSDIELKKVVLILIKKSPLKINIGSA